MVRGGSGLAIVRRHSTDLLPFVLIFRQADSSLTRRHGGSVSVSPSFVTSSSCTAEPSRRTVPVWDMARRLPSACPSIAGRGLRPRRRPPRSTYRCRGRPSFAWPQSIVVEDHDDARDLVACVLDAAGAEVTTAASSREALNGIAGTMPDLLLADLGLPDEDGYTLLRRIRRTLAAALLRSPSPRMHERRIANGYLQQDSWITSSNRSIRRSS